MAARGSGWADPQIFDAQLTDKGKQQVGGWVGGGGGEGGRGGADGALLDRPPAWIAFRRVKVTAGHRHGRLAVLGRDGAVDRYHAAAMRNPVINRRPQAGWPCHQQLLSLLPDIPLLQPLQARALRQELAKLSLPPDTLWITSPLQRAMQTLLLACPHAHLLGEGSGGGHSASGSAENSSAVPNGGGGAAPKVAVLHTITEKVGAMHAAERVAG